MAALGAAALAFTGISTIWTLDALSGGQMVEAAVNRAQGLADLLDQRSPGERTQAMLTKLKHARAAAKLRTPVHEADKAIVPPEMAKPTELAALMQSPVTLPAVVPGQSPLAAPPTLAGILTSVPGAPVISGGGGGFAPPGEKNGDITFPSSEPKEPLSPPSAVPEPSSWAVMLLGFGLMGWRLRRRTGRGSALASTAA